MTAAEILQKHEDANEMHFHQVDREWIIQAMEEYAKVCHNSTNISDKELFDQAILAMEEMYGSGCDEEIDAYFRGAKWMQQQFKLKLK